MYLSSLLIDVGANPDRPRPGRLWLRNVYHIHQRLCMAFPMDARKARDPEFLQPYDPSDFPEQRHLANRKKAEMGTDVLRQVHTPRQENAGFLYRIETSTRDRVMILVQSSVEPDWNYAFRNARHLLAAPPQIKTYQFDFTTRRNWKFRLVANPTKRLTDSPVNDKGERLADKWKKKRVPVPPSQWNVWLQRRAEQAGFTVDDANLAIQSGYIQFAKTKYQIQDDRKRGARLRSVRFDGTLVITDAALFQAAIASGIGSAKAFGFGLLSVAPI